MLLFTYNNLVPAAYPGAVQSFPSLFIFFSLSFISNLKASLGQRLAGMLMAILIFLSKVLFMHTVNHLQQCVVILRQNAAFHLQDV